MSVLLGVMFIGITILANRVERCACETVQETVISQIARTILRHQPDVLHHDDRHDRDPDHGGQHLLRRLPAAGCPGSPPTAFCPSRLTYRGAASSFRGASSSWRWRPAVLIVIFQRQPPRSDPALRDRCVHVVHAIADWHGRALAPRRQDAAWGRDGRPQVHGAIMRPDEHWRTKQIVNAFGAVMTFVVMIVFAVAKFSDGAWIVVIVIPRWSSSSSAFTSTTRTWRMR